MNAAEWIKAKPKEAAAGAGVLVVLVLAVVKSRTRKPAAADPAAATSTSTDATAGTTGIPNTLATDIENAVQDQLNTFQDQVNNQIAGLKPPAPTPTPAPKPKPPVKVPPLYKPPVIRKPVVPARPKAPAKTFTIPAGGTLWGAAQSIFGHATPANVAQLASQNNIKLYQRGGTTYADVFKGQVIRYQP